MKPPAFQFYADDFLAGTLSMTQQEVGAYIRLLCHQWSNGAIPGDADKLKRIACGKVSDEVLSKFDLGEDGLRRNGRMESERQKLDEFRKKQAANAHARWDKPKDATAYARQAPPHMPNACSPVSSLQSPSPEVSSTSELQATPPVAHVRRFTPPTTEEVALQCAKIGLPESEGEKFSSYYGANGWRVGRNPMRSWTHALNNWKSNWIERNAHPRNHTASPPGTYRPELSDAVRDRLNGPPDEWPEAEQPPAVDRPRVA